MKALWTPDIFRGVVSRINVPGIPVYFDYGHYKEVAKNLHFKDGELSQKDRKYPLVWLVMDFDEDINTFPGVYSQPTFQLIIATITEPEWSMDERYANSFDRYLYPVYNQLVQQITKEASFGLPPEATLGHRKTDRPYWGGDETPGGAGDKPNMFNDFIDAIQIRNLKLKIYPSCESTCIF